MIVEPLIDGVRHGLSALAVATLLFGGWSTAKPGRSIALYQAIMRRFNWRVEPINPLRELRTTRWLGILLVLLALVSFLLLQQAS